MTDGQQKLELEDYLTLAALLIRLIRVRIGLATKGFSVERNPELGVGAGKCTITIDQAHKMGWMMNGLSRRIGIGTCLHRSIALSQALGKRGANVYLRIGGRRVCDQFSAHAWLEWRGEVINDDPDIAKRFVPFSIDSIEAGRGLNFQ